MEQSESHWDLATRDLCPFYLHLLECLHVEMSVSVRVGVCLWVGVSVCAGTCIYG